MYISGFRKIMFPFCTFFRQNVTLKSMLALDFTRSSKLKSFFGTGYSFHFWHDLIYLCVIVIKLFFLWIDHHDHPFSFKFWKLLNRSEICEFTRKLQQ